MEPTSLVLTVIGPDRPGIVDSLAETLSRFEASWLESRMSRMAGTFAGILRVEVAGDRAAALADALSEVGNGLRVVVEREGADTPSPSQALRIRLVGNDRPGIVRKVSRVLAAREVNVEDLSTTREDAPMTGDVLFRATLDVRLPAGMGADELRRGLESLADDLMVEIERVEERAPTS